MKITTILTVIPIILSLASITMSHLYKQYYRDKIKELNDILDKQQKVIHSLNSENYEFRLSNRIT